MQSLNKNGVSITQTPGEEKFVKCCLGAFRGQIYFQYDYRHTDGELFIIEIGLCELRQVVAFFYDFIGEIFFIVIFPLILVPEITYKVVRIFLAQIMAFVVAPHEKGFLLGVAQILHRITQGKEIFRNPAFAD